MKTLHERQSELQGDGEGREPTQPVVGVDEVVARLLAPGELRDGFAELVGNLPETLLGNDSARASCQFVQDHAIGELGDGGIPGRPGDQIDLDAPQRQFGGCGEQGHVHAAGVSAARESRGGCVH